MGKRAMSKTLTLNLINNSISYFKEAVEYAQHDDRDEIRWKFAIVNVVQAMELAFKEKLRQIHPTFIYSSVDERKKTVSLTEALKRLIDPAIGAIKITESDSRKIIKAVSLRNELTHFECKHPHDHIETKFSDIFSFMIFFYREHLNLPTDTFIDYEQHQRIISLVKTRSELIKRAKTYIKSEGFIDIWFCPFCEENTFIADKEECFVCHHQEKIIHCKSCDELALESELIDTSIYFDWDYDEGRMVLLDNYGLEDTACTHCIKNYKDKIEEIRLARNYEDFERDIAFYI